MAKAKSKTPKVFQNLFEYESFLTILRYYVDLNCFVITPNPGTGETGWLAVHYHQRFNSLFEFEKKYGFKFNWDKLTDPAFEQSRGKGQPLLLESLGFQDIFMPIRRNSQRLGTILSGAFSDKEITQDQLRESWNRLTGQSASSENTEFRQFVRVMLETPVLEGPILLAFREALELFARILAYENIPQASRRLQELLTKVFSKNFPHSYWMDWALGLPTRQATPLWNLGIQEMDWIRSDIGISRVPTTVITAIPLNAFGKKRDAVEEMLRVYRFQRKSFQFAQTLPQTVGGKLENYGAVFVTSADPSKTRPQRRKQIAETAEHIRRFAAEEFGGPVLVGIGETVAPGEGLNESYRQAVLALHLERGSGREVIFSSQVPAEKSEGILEIMRLLQELKHQVEKASFSGLETVLDGFLKQVLSLSLQDPEEIRWHLQYGLIQMRSAMKTQPNFGEHQVSDLHESLVLSLERAGTTQEMVLAFKDALEKIFYLTQGAVALKAVYSIEKVRDYIADRFREPLKISKLAKLAGTSVSTFSRRFRKVTGVGFENYIQNLKLEEARRLLKSGSLPVSQVARDCGFKSGSHFARLFREKMKSTPQEFRKRAQKV